MIYSVADSEFVAWTITTISARREEMLGRWFKPPGASVKVIFKESIHGTLLLRYASDAELLAYRLGAERAYEAKPEDMPKMLEAES